MSWGNQLVRTLGLALLLPLVLSKLPQADIVVWYLFSSLMTLQLLVDVGFLQTFSRLIAYGRGGASVADFRRIRDWESLPPSPAEPNWKSIHCVERVMLRIYSRVTLAAFIIGASIGTWALNGPISRTSDVTGSWWAWLVVLLTTCWMLFGNYFSACLLGLNQVARVQRWRMLTALLATILASITLMLGGGLFYLVAIYQITLGMNVVINIWLKRVIAERAKHETATAGEVHTVWGVVWPVAWRSGAGILMSAGLIQLSGVIYAQIGETRAIASYLLGLQLARSISAFSQAPFYSKIPVLSSLYAAHDKDEIIRLAKKGMFLAYGVFAVSFIGLGMFSEALLALIDSNVEFPGVIMWTLLGLGFFVERYGAMHIQLYTVTNHIIWHVANGVSGLIMIVIGTLLYPFLEVNAFPLALLGGYVGFYAPYSACHSYQKFGLGFFSFERSVMLPWLAIMVAGAYLIYYAKS